MDHIISIIHAAINDYHVWSCSCGARGVWVKTEAAAESDGQWHTRYPDLHRSEYIVMEAN